MSVFKQHAAPLTAILVLMLLQGFYATRLNQSFYQQHAPFYDSCGYTNELADVAHVARTQGLWAGIHRSLSGNVALSWLEMTALAKFVSPSRGLGVWLQSVWLIALALSLYWYFARYRNAPSWVSLCLSLPFVSFAEIYHWNGGLPDFRMDLSLYIFLSLFFVWYLGTYETDAKLPWILAGIAGMLGCLARATAPVYLIVMLGPLLAIRFFQESGHRRELAARSALMAAPILFGLAIFQVYNYRFLHYYYAIFSLDANRHLPWRQSLRHFLVPAWHLGHVTILCSVAALAINWFCYSHVRIWDLDWKPIWLALAVPMFLCIRGAGLNWYVSLPAVFGCLLFANFPFRGPQPAFQRTPPALLICALAIGASVINLYKPNQGWHHGGASATSMAGFRAIIDRMSEDALVHGSHNVKYVAPMLGNFNPDALANVVIYEYGATPIRTDADDWSHESYRLVAKSGLSYYFPDMGAFIPSAEVEWELFTPGRTEEEKIAGLVKLAMHDADYLLVPDETTLARIERDPENYVNLKTRVLKTRLLATGAWVPLGPPAKPSADETIEIYARRR